MQPMRVLSLLACSSDLILGCPSEVVDLGPHDQPGAFPTAATFASELNGTTMTDPFVFGEVTLITDVNAASATVVIEATPCLEPAGDQIRYLTTAALHGTDTTYSGADVWRRSDEPDAAVNLITPLQGDALDWVQDRIAEVHPNAGPIVEVTATWIFADQLINLGAYDDQGDEYRWDSVPDLLIPFELTPPP